MNFGTLNKYLLLYCIYMPRTWTVSVTVDTGGYYMFVSPSSLRSGGGDVRHRALLTSRPLSVSTSSRRSAQCLHLAYQFTGDACSFAVNILSVDYLLSSGWTQNCDLSDSSWRELELTLSENKPFQVRHFYYSYYCC